MLVQFPNEKQMEPLTLLCNTGSSGVFSNVRENLTKGYVKFKEEKANSRVCLICGSGPSLGDTLESIRAMQKRGAFVIALNGAARFLTNNGIVPNVVAMVDPRPENIDFVKNGCALEAWIASQCHPSIGEQCEKSGMPVTLWHPGIPEIQNHIPARDSLRMGGGYSIGLCAISCAFVAGYRELHLFGYDSSHRGGKGHAFTQAINADDELMTCTVDSYQFVCSVTMAAQASQFLEFTKHVLNDGGELHVHGDGLIPTLWQIEQRKKARCILTACYDLGVSPPTYDFISFLAEAERHRIANNYDILDVIFQPGPMHGFRVDELPPDLATRQGMLWRVCAGIARLLPSVRNIEILNERRPVTGDVFPGGWADNHPVNHYGSCYQVGATEMLRASDYARAWAFKKYGENYVTITLRSASHWLQRNSNAEAWIEVANFFYKNGINVVIVPDCEKRMNLGYEECIEASYDIDLRAALYEGAKINLGVANGPIWLLPFLKARYLIFNMCVESAYSASREFLLANGITKDTDFGGNGRVIWEADTADVIIRELQEFNIQIKEKTS